MAQPAYDLKPVRTAWLAAMIVLHRAVTYPEYATRFSRSVRTYYADLMHVRRAGIQFASQRDGGKVVSTGESL